MIPEETHPALFAACRTAVERRLVIGLASQTGWSMAHMACLYARLGETDRALDTIGRAIGGGYENFRWMQHDPDLDSLRGDPRFQQLVQGR